MNIKMRIDVDTLTSIQKLFPGKTVLQIIDYAEKGIYTVRAVPNNRVKDADKWLDGIYSVKKNDLTKFDGFQPMMNDPEIYFNLPEDRIIYKVK